MNDGRLPLKLSSPEGQRWLRRSLGISALALIGVVGSTRLLRSVGVDVPMGIQQGVLIFVLSVTVQPIGAPSPRSRAERVGFAVVLGTLAGVAIETMLRLAT